MIARPALRPQQPWRGPALIVGVGNPLAGDDGAGPEVARRLDRRQGISVRICHQLTPELASEVAGASLVIVVDAAHGGGPVRTRRLAGAWDGSPVTHAMAPGAVLALAGALYGRVPPTYLVSIPGRRFEPGTGLSGGVRRLIPTAVRAVERVLQTSAPEGETVVRPT